MVCTCCGGEGESAVIVDNKGETCLLSFVVTEDHAPYLLCAPPGDEKPHFYPHAHVKCRPPLPEHCT